MKPRITCLGLTAANRTTVRAVRSLRLQWTECRVETPLMFPVRASLPCLPADWTETNCWGYRRVMQNPVKSRNPKEGKSPEVPGGAFSICRKADASVLRLGETRHGSTAGGNPVAHLRSRSGEGRPHGSRYRNADEGRDRPRGGIWSRGSLRGPRCICSKRMRRFHWRGSRLRSGADSCAAGSAPVSNGTFRTPWRSLHNQGSRVPSSNLRVTSGTFE